MTDEKRRDLKKVIILALSKRLALANMMKRGLESGEPNDTIIVSGLVAERMTGFAIGVSAAIAVLDGENAFDVFESFVTDSASMADEALMQVFSEEVELFNETGEG